MMRLAVLLVLPVFVGCVAAPDVALPPQSFDFPRAEEKGPADYVYAETHRYFDESVMTRRIAGELKNELERDERQHQHYLELAMLIRNTPGLSEAERRARYETYVSAAFSLNEGIRRQTWNLGDLESHLGLLMGKMRRETLRGAAFEKGDVPAATR